MKDKEELLQLATSLAMAQNEIECLGFKENANGFHLQGFKYEPDNKDDFQHWIYDSEALMLTQQYFKNLQAIYQKELNRLAKSDYSAPSV